MYDIFNLITSSVPAGRVELGKHIADRVYPKTTPRTAAADEPEAASEA